MTNRHSLLERQIRKFLGQEEASRAPLQAFLRAVNDAYRQSDADRLMLERSLELSSQELLQANSEMRGIFQALPDLFLRLDPEGRILDYKASSDIDLYLPPAELVGKRIQDVPIPEAAGKFGEALADLNGGARMAEVVYRLPLPEGEAWYEARVLRLLEDQLIAVIRNVTALRRAEQERRLRLERVERQQSITARLASSDAIATGDLEAAFSAIAEAAGRALDVDSVCVWVSDPDGARYRAAVRHGCQTGGVPRGAELEASAHRTYCRTLETGGPIVVEDPATDPRTRSLGRLGLIEREHRSLLHAPVRRAGRLAGILWLAQESPRTWHDDEIAFAGMIADQAAQALSAHDQRKREADLLRAQKLESLGVLAGGIAHDFNNTLTGILGNLSIALAETDLSADAAEALREAEAATVRATSLTRQLLTFAKGGKPVKRTVSLPRLLRESVTFALRGSNVRPDLDVPEELPPVEIDPGQMGQVIHNLVINADQAMPDGGTLTVQAEPVRLPDPDRPGAIREFVKVTLRDEGVGIPEEHLSTIFDPYFTTKQGGTGLGLASTYSIIRNHGGEIDVVSDVGRGTTFALRLPVSRGPVRDRKRDAPGTRGAGRRVLVMDDESAIRDVVARMLGRLGYDAVTAPDGQAAVELYREADAQGRAFDAVLLDLTVPGGMGGRETLQRLRRIDPDVKAIVCSGYSNDPVMADFRQHGFRGVIGKPFRIQDLDRAVSALFTAGSAEKGRRAPARA